jgi:hypothetical protein
MMFPKKNKNQPTLKVRRRPGQSIRDEKERLLENRLMPYVFVPSFFWLIFVVEAFRSWTEQPPQPQFWFFLSVAATVFGWIGYRRLLPAFRGLNRGERGELRVAEILDDLRGSGYRAFHDLTGDEDNIDHVVVGPAGVFAIETKFRSGGGEIEYRNGEGLFLSGRKIDEEERDPLKQARGSARSVRKQLKDRAGRNIWTKAVLVYVGDWRIKDDWMDTDVSVLATDDLPNYFTRYQPELLRHEIDLICSHLQRSAKR